MNIKIIGENNYMGDLQCEFFHNRGIKDIDAFINLNNVKETHYSEFQNMEKALELLMKHVELGSNIGIVVDADTDGVTSASALHNYLVTYFDNEVKLSIHRKKVHGIFINELEEDGLLGWCNLLIVPDAGTNDSKQAKELVKKYGMDILVLDHHPATVNNPYVTLVNNQVSNVALDYTGATMVYKFLQGLDDIIGESASDDYLDLVAVGMVGDMADTTNPEVQLLIRKGLTNVCNPMFESIIEKQSFSIKGKINQMTFSFNIIPLINAATRIADYEDMKIIVEAFCGIDPDRTFEYEPSRGKNKGELLIETLYEYTARLLVSIKGKQDRAVKKVLEGSKRPPQVGLYDILDGTTSDKKVLLIDATDYIEEGGLSGLLANKIRSRYNRPTLVVSRNDKGKYRGSGRGEQIEMFRSKLEKSEHIEFAQGHEPAFGFMLNIPKPIEKDKEEKEEIKPDIKQIEADLNKMFENEDTNAEYVVDFSLHGDFIEDYMIEELCQLEDYWGNGIDKPVFHVYDIVVSSEVIDTGKEESKFAFTHNDIEFILFKPSPEKMAELVDWSDTMCYNLIGEPNINEFDGRRIVQIIISAIERVKSDSEEESNGDVLEDDWDNGFDDLDNKFYESTQSKTKQDKKEEVEDDFEW